PLQAFPSLQGVPLATVECRQPRTRSQVSRVHGFPSSQFGASPGLQRPFWQVSRPLHVLPSLHGVPFVAAVCWQPPVGRHVSVEQRLLSLHGGGGPAVQMPFTHASTPLQMLPSLHEGPSVTETCRQPFVGSQLSTVQRLWSSHDGATPGVHTPARHVSAPLQALPSLQEVPFDTGVCLQPMLGSQVSSVQGFKSSQTRFVPEPHTPA